MWYNYLKILQFFPHYPFCHSTYILVLCSFVWPKLYVKKGLHRHTKIDTWCAGCSCFMQGLNDFLICTVIDFSCHANWRVWCCTQAQMPGAAQSLWSVSFSCTCCHWRTAHQQVPAGLWPEWSPCCPTKGKNMMLLLAKSPGFGTKPLFWSA